MGTETHTTASERVPALGRWQAGAVGGLVGGAIFGAMLSVQLPGILANAIPALYGLGPDAMAVGFVLHLFHAAVFGLAFAGIVGATGLERVRGDALGNAAVLEASGLAYGLLVWLVFAGLIMPLWLQAVGFPAAPEAVPNVVPRSVIGHLVYGAVLGVVYAVTART